MSKLNGLYAASPGVRQDRKQREFGAGTDTGAVMVGGQHSMNPNLPERKAKLADEIIGKTQKVAGKVTSQPAMHEKGKLREAGGKTAAQGQARAPHD
ncbi:hypothetical protein VTO73DRAFT_11779 [Trametes versicolor]